MQLESLSCLLLMIGIAMHASASVYEPLPKENLNLREFLLVNDTNHGCHFYNSKASCIGNKEKGEHCVWCRSAAVPSTCYNETEAQQLPPGVFTCEKKTQIQDPANHGCHFYNSKASCIGNTEKGEHCFWCRSAAVPSTCYNETEAKQLPPGVFTCDNKHF